MQLRQQYISGIKQRAVVEVELLTPTNQKYTIIGNSQFDVVEGDIGKRRLIVNAIFGAFYRAMNRYNLPTGTIITSFKILGFQTPESVNVKRVSVRGRYRTYVFVKGKRGVQRNVKWSSSGINGDLEDDISDELDLGEWR